jgi:hypothetical protein
MYSGALRGVIEAERVVEMILFGAYYKYSSTGTSSYLDHSKVNLRT